MWRLGLHNLSRFVNVETTRRTATHVTTVALGCVAAYVAVLLVLATPFDAVGNVLAGDRYGTAAFLLLIALLVFGAQPS